MNYLGKFLPLTAEVCKPLRKLTLLKFEWTWNNTYQNLQDRAKTIIKKTVTMTFFNEKEQPYLERDALGAGLGVLLLQTRDEMQL